MVDDDERILRFLRIKLRNSGYDTLSATTSSQALNLLKDHEPDVIVLDLVMPGIDGMETLKNVRTISEVPVIILSARVRPGDKIEGLRNGADDYLTKPFNPDELVARIEALKRRPQFHAEEELPKNITIGNILIDFKKRSVQKNGNEIYLTLKEWLLFSELARNSGQIMLYHDLLTRVWGVEYREDIHILRSWICRLREKVEDNPSNPSIIRTEPKCGYFVSGIL